MLAYLGHWRGLADLVTEKPATRDAGHMRFKGGYRVLKCLFVRVNA
jgi:hypothetical protein